MRWSDLQLVEIDGVVDFASVFARLEEGDLAKEADHRRKAANQRQKTVSNANKAIQAAAASDAEPQVKAARINTQNAKKREADATFRAAVAEGANESFALVVPPRGKAAIHYDGSGRLVATTEWEEDELVTKAANGVVVGRTAIR